MESPRKPILNIGAGIARLALAQGLRKASSFLRLLSALNPRVATTERHPILVVPFERDASARSRPHGWALTIHLSLPRMLELLPEDITSRLHTSPVDPTMEHDPSLSVFLNLEDCTAKWRLPPTYGNRMRVARRRLRDLLLEGLDGLILWGKNLRSLDVGPDGAQARSVDGSQYNGELLIGVDGLHSRGRSLVYGPELARFTPIPACFLGPQALATEKQIGPLLGLDPTLFQ